jgi:hypothetical protein
MPQYRDRAERAFTLLELLVATTVATAMMVLLAGVSTQIGKMLTEGYSQNQNRNSARIAMNFMIHEMKQALISRQKNYSLGATSVSALQFVINPSALSQEYANPDAVFWQAPIATVTSSGDIAEVGYFIARQSKIDGVSGRAIYHSDLCRFYVTPADTSNFKIYTNPDAWVTTALVAQFVPQYPDYQGLFLENVIGLWVVPYKSDGSIMNTTAGAGNSMTTDHSYDSRTNNLISAPIDRLPSLVQVSMLIIDSHSIKKLTNQIEVTGYNNAEDCLSALRLHAASDASLRQVLTGIESVYFSVSLDNYNP